jgi:acetate kinase
MKTVLPHILTINGGSSSTVHASRVAVRVIPTDEEHMIAQMVCGVLGLDGAGEKRC